MWLNDFWMKIGVSAFLVLVGGVFAGLTLALMGLDELHLMVLSVSSLVRGPSRAGQCDKSSCFASEGEALGARRPFDQQCDRKRELANLSRQCRVANQGLRYKDKAKLKHNFVDIVNNSDREGPEADGGDGDIRGGA
ncbi:hypothetical protein GGX14DRAFT_661980 [Mycena pura]|uniref:Uncharacterized protein n=1 Tax=Mycena pura TaxID=153505 RepID=A0AAD6V104_9AGAR|nr:hypothetical protein GGX14DRAFT_661980 [Mycena pura]